MTTAEIPLDIDDIIDHDDRDSSSPYGRALYRLFETIHLDTESVFHLVLCDMSPVVPSIVRSLKIVSRGKESQLPPLPNVTSLHVLDDLWQIYFLASMMMIQPLSHGL